MNNDLPYLVIGSTALLYHGDLMPINTSKGRRRISVTPGDCDIFYPDDTPDPSINFTKPVDAHSIPRHIYDQFTHQSGHIDLHSQYILKLSHSEYDIHWKKTINHLQLIRRLTVIDLSSMTQSELNLLHDLKEYWKIVHKDRKRGITLNKYPESFFNSKVKRKYCHDMLHRSVMYFDEPMYKRILKNNHPVMVDQIKWTALSFDEKLKCAREEIYTIALERFIIPNDMKFCKHEAYRLALKKVVTTMTKGFFPLFIIDNYHILCKIDKDYILQFKETFNV